MDRQLQELLNNMCEETQALFDAGHINIQQKNNPQEIIIKPELLDTSSLIEGEGNKTLYRPENFEQYIGQDMAKERLKSRIEGTKKLKEQFAHTLITGVAGQGKTTLAYILSRQLGLKFVEANAITIKSEQQFVDYLIECDGGVIFIDEIQKLRPKIATFLLPILEDFQINGKKIKPFTLIGATTDIGELFKKIKPFIRRFLIRIELEDYKNDDIEFILKQYHEKKYNQFKIDQKVFDIIVENSKLNPAFALSLFKDYLCCEDINTVLNQNNIITKGLTDKDIKVLNYLSNKKNGASKATISYHLGIPIQNYEFEIEPFLLKCEMLEIDSKRKITDKGKEFLKELQCLSNKTA